MYGPKCTKHTRSYSEICKKFLRPDAQKKKGVCGGYPANFLVRRSASALVRNFSGRYVYPFLYLGAYIFVRRSGGLFVRLSGELF